MKSSVILISLFKLFSCIAAQNTCKKVNSCKCKLDDGKVIDLEPLANSNGPANSGKTFVQIESILTEPEGVNISRFAILEVMVYNTKVIEIRVDQGLNTWVYQRYLDVSDSAGADLYSWNPCKPFSEGTCTNAAVCQTHAGQQYNCGSQDSAVFAYDSSSQIHTITYQADTYTNDVRTTVLFLYCDENADLFQPVGELTQQSYALTYRGKYACPRDDSGLSAGTILIIIFFCLVTVYLIGGVLFQIFVRKNSGIKVIPNHSFWSGLPILIKDGVFFIVRRGGKKTSYNSI